MTTLVKETVATATTVIDPLRTVDNSVYTRDAFELQQEHIFRKVWNFVCHESEIRNPGDFITKEIVSEPILVARDDSGALRAYYNVCRQSLIARGQDSLTGIRSDDNRLRQFWARWREMMGTEGNSIHRP